VSVAVGAVIGTIVCSGEGSKVKQKGSFRDVSENLAGDFKCPSNATAHPLRTLRINRVASLLSPSDSILRSAAHRAVVAAALTAHRVNEKIRFRFHVSRDSDQSHGIRVPVVPRLRKLRFIPADVPRDVCPPRKSQLIKKPQLGMVSR